MDLLQKKKHKGGFKDTGMQMSSLSGVMLSSWTDVEVTQALL